MIPDTGNYCLEPVRFERWAGEQLELVSLLDPDWPGSPPRPDGDGWIWVVSVADILRRFCGLLPFGSGQRLTQVGWADLEIVASANEAARLRAVHEKLYLYGFHPGTSPWALGFRSPGQGLGLDIEGRGGAWVRRIEDPPAWVFGEEDDAA